MCKQFDGKCTSRYQDWQQIRIIPILDLGDEVMFRETYCSKGLHYNSYDTLLIYSRFALTLKICTLTI